MPTKQGLPRLMKFKRKLRKKNVSNTNEAQLWSYVIRNSVLCILPDMYRCSSWGSGYKSRHSNTVFWYTTYLIRMKQGDREVRAKPRSVQTFFDVFVQYDTQNGALTHSALYIKYNTFKFQRNRLPTASKARHVQTPQPRSAP